MSFYDAPLFLNAADWLAIMGVRDGRRFFTPPPQKLVGDQSFLWQRPVDPLVVAHPVMLHWTMRK